MRESRRASPVEQITMSALAENTATPVKPQRSHAALTPPVIAKRSLALFELYLSWFVPRHFHALRITNAKRFPSAAHPLIVCINHASWWDPILILLLTRHLAPGRFAFAPMEAAALEHYGFFRKLGAFPVDNTSIRAGTHFLRQAAAVLSGPSSILWMTPEGKFTDPRQRPLAWKSGTAALTRHIGDCTVVPLAIEYIFWDERLPEVLCNIGEPIHFTSADTSTTEQRSALLQKAMTLHQDELASLAATRDASHFGPVFAGRAGVSPVYNLWLRAKSIFSRRPYIAEHSAIAPK